MTEGYEPTTETAVLDTPHRALGAVVAADGGLRHEPDILQGRDGNQHLGLFAEMNLHRALLASHIDAPLLGDPTALDADPNHARRAALGGQRPEPDLRRLA